MRESVPPIQKGIVRQFKNRNMRLPPNKKAKDLKRKLHHSSRYVKDYVLDWETYWAAFSNRALHTD